jgi:hypothetical protein
MCINNEKLTFCTCSEKEVKASDNYDSEIYYTWLLTSYIGYKKSRIRGKLLMPSNDLEKGLTVSRILEMLNSNLNYFDFNYHPKELDCLHIDNNLKHPFYQYFSVIYKNNLWQRGSNPAFVSLTKTIAQGRISKEVTEPEKTSNWLVSQEKLSVNQLFDKLLSEKNIKEQWRFITALVNRFPKESFQKAYNLCNTNSKTDKISGFRLMSKLYESEYNLEQIKSFLFKRVESENDKEIIETLIFSLTSNLSLLRDEEIKSLLSLKERGDNFKVVLMDELISYNHKLVIDFFLELCIDTNLGVKQKAIMNLSYEDDLDTPKIRKVLWENVENQNKKVRQYSIYGLALRKDNNIKSILEKELQYIDNDGSLILEAIEELGDKKMKPLLESKLEQLNSDNKYLSKLLIDTIENI